MSSEADFPTDLFHRSDLVDAGIPPGRLRRALTHGEVRRVLRGWYVPAAVEDTYDLRIEAVRRAIAPGHIACDRTAAWIHGVDVLGAPGEPPPVEVCRLRWESATSRGDLKGRNRSLAREDVMEVRGLLVTTPLRTALDLGCILQRRDALAALDGFRRSFGFEREDLSRSAVRYFRRRGVVQLRELIPLSDPRAESARESWTRLAIHDAGLPAPVPQLEIESGGVVLFRLDLAYPEYRVAVEYDGAEFHDAPGQRAHDERRRAWLRANGWTVIVVRRGDFTGQQLQAWIGRLRTALWSPYSNLRW